LLASTSNFQVEIDSIFFKREIYSSSFQRFYATALFGCYECSKVKFESQVLLFQCIFFYTLFKW
jgi:hypothetical protein